MQVKVKQNILTTNDSGIVTVPSDLYLDDNINYAITVGKIMTLTEDTDTRLYVESELLALVREYLSGLGRKPENINPPNLIGTAPSLGISHPLVGLQQDSLCYFGDIKITRKEDSTLLSLRVQRMSPISKTIRVHGSEHSTQNLLYLIKFLTLGTRLHLLQDRLELETQALSNADICNGKVCITSLDFLRTRL